MRLRVERGRSNGRSLHNHLSFSYRFTLLKTVRGTDERFHQKEESSSRKSTRSTVHLSAVLTLSIFGANSPYWKRLIEGLARIDSLTRRFDQAVTGHDVSDGRRLDPIRWAANGIWQILVGFRRICIWKLRCHLSTGTQIIDPAIVHLPRYRSQSLITIWVSE